VKTDEGGEDRDQAAEHEELRRGDLRSHLLKPGTRLGAEIREVRPHLGS
jgi:hypothetical protein